MSPAMSRLLVGALLAGFAAVACLEPVEGPATPGDAGSTVPPPDVGGLEPHTDSYVAPDTGAPPEDSGGGGFDATILLPPDAGADVGVDGGPSAGADAGSHPCAYDGGACPWYGTWPSPGSCNVESSCPYELYLYCSPSDPTCYCSSYGPGGTKFAVTRPAGPCTEELLKGVWECQCGFPSFYGDAGYLGPPDVGAWDGGSNCRCLPNGARCTDGQQCQGGICWNSVDGGHCTPYCGDAGECPNGYTCQTLTIGSSSTDYCAIRQ